MSKIVRVLYVLAVVVVGFMLLGCDEKKNPNDDRLAYCAAVQQELDNFRADPGGWFGKEYYGRRLDIRLGSRHTYGQTTLGMLLDFSKLPAHCVSNPPTKDEWSRLVHANWVQYAQEQFNKIKKMEAPAKRDYSREQGVGAGWKWDGVRDMIAELSTEEVHANWGKVTLEEAGITESVIHEVEVAYRRPLAERLSHELWRYPTKILADSPDQLVEMILQADPSRETKEANLKTLASLAYARLAERELRSLREWQYEYPETLDAIAWMNSYLEAGRLKLANIGTTPQEVNLLKRERPSLAERK